MGAYPGSAPRPGMGPAGGGSPSGPGQDAGAGPGAGQNPAPANPAQATATQTLGAIAMQLKQYADAYPQCQPEIRQIGELLRRCMMKTTQAQPAQEPAVPPV